jgi:hypothetical protein
MRFRKTLIVIIIAALGLASALYDGPAKQWVNDSLAGMLYEIFWCLLFSLLFARARPVTIALSVFAGTCALEFLQVWHPAHLEYFRAFFLGRALIGNCFSWVDFPYYAAGSIIGGILVKQLR